MFRRGAEVCNYLQADSLVRIVCQHGSHEDKEIVWPGGPTLDAPLDVTPIGPANFSDPHRATYFEPVAESAPAAKDHKVAIPNDQIFERQESPSNADGLREAALELDIGMAVIFEQLTHAGAGTASDFPVSIDREYGVTTICGIKYDFEGFRFFGFDRLGLRLVERADGVVTVEQLEEQSL